MSPRIIADASGVHTSGVNLSGYNQFTVQLFRTAFAMYRHLVKPGEQLNGQQWADRIMVDTDHDLIIVAASHAVVLKVMGGV